MSEFYDYFSENMDALGLPAPRALYGNLQSMLTTVTAINLLIEKLGPRITVRELIGAGTLQPVVASADHGFARRST